MVTHIYTCILLSQPLSHMPIGLEVRDHRGHARVSYGWPIQERSGCRPWNKFVTASTNTVYVDLAWRRHVSRRDRIRSTQRLPWVLAVPCDRLRQRTPNRKARLNSARGSLPPLVSRTVRATFAAHGSSVERSLVMSTYPLGEFVKSTVYLVMTVTMNRRKVDVPVVGSVSIEVMVFDQVLRLEKESTCLAAPSLFLQQRRKSPRHAWVLPPSCRPVAPVPIIRAGLASHFDMSNNRHARVLVECRPVLLPEIPAFARRGVPVSLDCPPPTFAWMPEKRPSSEFLIESVVEQMEGLRTDHRPIIIGPAGDHRVEYPNQVRLLGRLVAG